MVHERDVGGRHVHRDAGLTQSAGEGREFGPRAHHQNCHVPPGDARTVGGPQPGGQVCRLAHGIVELDDIDDVVIPAGGGGPVGARVGDR